MYAFSGNKYFFTKIFHHQTYQNYEQSRQKLGTFVEDEISVSPIFIKEKKSGKIQPIFNTEKQL